MKFQNVMGKRLLVLGSKPIIAEIVKKAQSMGVTVGVVDYVPYDKALGKQIADEYYDISLADTDEVAMLVKERKFDGVLTGFTDSYLPFYFEICEKAEVPCYGGAWQFQIATDKYTFKQACTESGLAVVPGGDAKNLFEAKAVADLTGYPLMLKPSDNSGSRGVVRCDEESEIENTFTYAQSYASNGIVIIEKYMDCPSIGVSYYLKNGNAHLSSTCDRSMYICEETGSAIAGSLHYPSRFEERFKDRADSLVCSFLQKNHFMEGMVSLQAFVDTGCFYFCEMCYRPSGGHHYIFIQDQTGIDELGCLIQYALTGASSDYSSFPKGSLCFHDSCHVGKVQGISGSSLARVKGLELANADPRVLFISLGTAEGATVGKKATTAQTLATIWFKCSEEYGSSEVMKDIAQTLVFEDVSGESIVEAYLG